MTTVADEITLFSMRQVCELTNFSRPTLYAMVRKGAFPRPRTFGGPRSFRWIGSEIREWIASRPFANGGVYGGLDADEQGESQ